MDGLSVKQSRCVDAVVACKGNYSEAAKLTGDTRQFISQQMKIPKVNAMFMHRDSMAMKFVDGAMNDPVITKQEIARMYVEIANAGMERGFDRDGNSIMMNPGAANTALSNVNGMYGYNAPTEVIETKVTRTEIEIQASVQALQTELGALLEMEVDEETKLASHGSAPPGFAEPAESET